MTASTAEETQARVVESFGRRAIVATANARVAAEVFGKRLTVVCGDRVRIRSQPQADAPRIVALLPRKSTFARTDSRGRTEILAANLTVLGVILAAEPPPDPFVIDRYLAGAAYANLKSLILVNKTDLPAAKEFQFTALIDEYTRAGYTVLRLAARSQQSLDELRTLLRDESVMLVGQSGVGKSTLTNALAPSSFRPTRELSNATGEGRHTTVSTALFQIPTGGELIDSPGVRDYAPALVADAMVQTGWPELQALAPQCRFNDCLHLREPGCAVLAALAAEKISARRYESYKRLLNLSRQLAPAYERR